jgi:hypothetical protein
LINLLYFMNNQVEKDLRKCVMVFWISDELARLMMTWGSLKLILVCLQKLVLTKMNFSFLFIYFTFNVGKYGYLFSTMLLTCILGLYPIFLFNNYWTLSPTLTPMNSLSFIRDIIICYYSEIVFFKFNALI